MSGTSLDGIDAVLVRFAGAERGLEWEVLARAFHAYSPDLQAGLQNALRPDTSDVLLLTQLHTEVGHAYADLVASVQSEHKVDLVALSGQTVYHIPQVDEAMGWRIPSTLQLGEASIVTERCGVNVYSDFRQGDMAAGGQGAPLVSFGDLQLFQQPGMNRAVHNLGGISNLTYLPASGDPGAVFAFDTGPASCLINEAMQRHYGLDFDEDGQRAATGQVATAVLAELLQHPYLKQALPKTTGRELFTLAEIEKEVALSQLAADDLVATLTAFSAASVADAYQRYVLPLGLDEVIVAGGGALNPTLMDGIRSRLDVPVKTFNELGWNPKDREALAFGVMAYFARHGLVNTLPSATGARKAVIAGKLSVASS